MLKLTGAAVGAGVLLPGATDLPEQALNVAIANRLAINRADWIEPFRQTFCTPCGKKENMTIPLKWVGTSTQESPWA